MSRVSGEVPPGALIMLSKGGVHGHRRFKFLANRTDTHRMLYLILNTLRDLLRPNRDLLLENLALRQQILVLQRTNPKPPFSLLVITRLLLIDREKYQV